MCNKKTHKYEEPYVGSYTINNVWSNGNVTIRQGDVKDHIKTIWIKPYNEK